MLINNNAKGLVKGDFQTKGISLALCKTLQFCLQIILDCFLIF